MSESHRNNQLANKFLSLSAKFWFISTVIGQWIFVFYIASFYGGNAIQGDFEAWNKVLPHGYVAGKTLHNVAISAHVMIAIIIIGGGPLQLIPKIRQFAPRFHRWNGRIYMIGIYLTSIAGLYMIWTKPEIRRPIQDLGITLDAVLIMVFGALAWRTALKGDLKNHRRWALRTFLVVSAVWFFRIDLMFWLFINNGPVGFDPKTFTGPFLNILSFAQYLLPLAILELYFYSQDRGSNTIKITTSSVLAIASLAMIIGIFAATMGMWLPRI